METPKMSYVKRFPADFPYEKIRREARLQRRAANLGISPHVKRCTASTIVMEDMDAPCLAIAYGDTIEDIPEWIREQILDILYALYTIGIEYIDVTPYNFIERDGVVWVIDFGDANDVSDEIHPYLDDLFASWVLSKWNVDFE